MISIYIFKKLDDQPCCQVRKCFFILQSYRIAWAQSGKLLEDGSNFSVTTAFQLRNDIMK